MPLWFYSVSYKRKALLSQSKASICIIVAYILIYSNQLVKTKNKRFISEDGGGKFLRKNDVIAPKDYNLNITASEHVRYHKVLTLHHRLFIETYVLSLTVHWSLNAETTL